MEKSLIQSAVNKFTGAGITAWGLYVRGGNYELRHNGKDEFNFLTNDYVLNIKNLDASMNYSRKGQFEINMVPYENIDHIYPIEVSYVEALDLLKSLGISDPELNKFLANPGLRHTLNVNSRAFSEGDILDKDKKPVTELSGKSAYIMEADADRRVERAENSESAVPKSVSMF